MSDDALFAFDPAQVRPDGMEGMSAAQRLTFRQSAAIARGQHPLSLQFGHMPLHAEAAPVTTKGDRADGRCCRNCAFRQEWGAHGFPKCSFGDGVRRSHGAATDVRAWWPGCRDHQYESEVADG